MCFCIHSFIFPKYELKRTETSKGVCVCVSKYNRALRKTSTSASVQVLEQFTLEDVRKLGRQACDVSPFVVSRLNIHTTITFSRITHRGKNRSRVIVCSKKCTQ